MIGSAAKKAEPANVKVVPDLARRLARFRSVQMPLPAGLTVKERKLVGKLVEASQYLESIYWRQIDPEALALYQSLEGSKNPRDIQLRRYLWINASRFDLIDENKPFVGKEPMSPGRGFYPQGLTRDKVETFVKEHPGEKSRTLQCDDCGEVARRSAGSVALPHRLSLVSRTRGQSLARCGCAQRRSRVRQFLALARRCVADRRLLPKRPGVARSQESEV